MVKFSKQLEGQLVPEWKHAFVDYCLLKKDLKRMQQHALAHGHCHGLTSTQETTRQQQQPSSLSYWLFNKLPAFFCSNAPKDHGAIQVRRRLASGRGGDVSYETEVVEQMAADTDTEAEAEAAREFFSRLDAQLNKVNRFYRGKEKEFLERGESLRKQLEILTDLKASTTASSSSRRGRPNGGGGKEPSVSCSHTTYSEDESTRYAATATDMDQNQQGTTLALPDMAQEDQPATTIPDGLEGSRSFESLGRSVTASRCHRKNLKVSIPLTTPSRTISALTDLVWDELVAGQSKKCSDNAPDRKQSVVSKTKLRHAEKMIKGAFVELYKGLSYLATYRNLNMMAFVKILKKFEKVRGKQVLSAYLKVVETSYFNSSGEALRLMDEVEDVFVRYFAGDDRRKAMKYLKPTQRKESHTLTFFIGLLTGCFAVLSMFYCVMAHVAGMYTTRRRGGGGSGGSAAYMETAYPVLSMFSLLFLHLFLYGCNVVAWRKARVNYGFIFELAGGEELSHRDVFLVCAASMTAVAGVMLAHLSLVARAGYLHASPRVQAIPGILLLVFLLLLFCPFNVVYRSSRFRFLRILRNIALSPIYKVAMVDFFMADQLCSQVPMLRSLEYVACSYISGSYRTQEYGYCINDKHIRDLAYAVSFLPYYWRAMQCARRWFDEGETSHLVNLGKYVSAMLAAGAKVAYEKDKSLGSLSLLVAVSSIATLYQLYWDFVKDWGLLQANSKNPWLRNELILKRKSVYYLSMGLNLVLRLAWLQTVIHPNFGRLDSRVTSFFLAALEVIRRGHWNFYRLENEHLNNAGKFRAVKTVPLPFHEVDED